jgi:uncharacterized protein YjiS (DUF1127 family)
MPRASAPALRSAFATAAGALASAVDTLLVWHDRARQRRALRAIGDDMLHDIGVSRIDALNEARKPFWRN